MGGQVGVGGHITLADNTTIAGQAGVLGNVKESGKILMGTPAIPYKEYFRSYAMFKKAGKQF
jgi:UDP-3-O-[3-hydroxymyristoyl] glucosamine N-acyltransferase